MLCRKSYVKSGGSVAVHLNVYDLTSINGYAYWLGLGVYHSGVQVHGIEYAFGAHEYPTTGIFEGEPKQCEGFIFRKTILIGWTNMTPGEVRVVMEKLSEKYRGNAYNLISKNCNHFCNDACIKLTGNPIPNWVNRLARIVHGIEYAFGAHEYPTTGIFEGEPKQCEGFIFRKTILIGWTNMTPGEVRVVMEKLSEKYRGNAYNLISKNCNHFCNDACIKLTGNPIPNWVNRLARIGFLCKCVIPANLNTKKVGHHKTKDKVCEVEKKNLRSQSNRFSIKSSDSSSSSSCSSPIAITTSDHSLCKRSSPTLSLPLVVDSSTK